MAKTMLDAGQRIRKLAAQLAAELRQIPGANSVTVHLHGNGNEAVNVQFSSPALLRQAAQEHMESDNRPYRHGDGSLTVNHVANVHDVRCYALEELHRVTSPCGHFEEPTQEATPA